MLEPPSGYQPRHGKMPVDDRILRYRSAVQEQLSLVHQLLELDPYLIRDKTKSIDDALGEVTRSRESLCDVEPALIIHRGAVRACSPDVDRDRETHQLRSESWMASGHRTSSSINGSSPGRPTSHSSRIPHSGQKNSQRRTI